MACSITRRLIRGSTRCCNALEELTFAKQPVIERATGTIVGYAGVNWFDFEGERRLEFGWRLVPEARGKGYATEAAGKCSRQLVGASRERYSP